MKMKLIKTPKPLRDRRGVSAVVSNMILIGAVLTVGFAMLAWSQSQSAIYNNQYSAAIHSDTEQLRERIAFEYIYYDNTLKILKVHLMNSGTVDRVSIANVYVNGTIYPAPILRSLLSDAQASSLNATQEGYFSISPNPILDLGKNYPITIVTWRGSSFAATFAT